MIESKYRSISISNWRHLVLCLRRREGRRRGKKEIDYIITHMIIKKKKNIIIIIISYHKSAPYKHISHTSIHSSSFFSFSFVLKISKLEDISCLFLHLFLKVKYFKCQLRMFVSHRHFVFSFSMKHFSRKDDTHTDTSILFKLFAVCRLTNNKNNNNAQEFVLSICLSNGNLFYLVYKSIELYSNIDT